VKGSMVRVVALAAGILAVLAFLLAKTRIETHDRHLNLLLQLQKQDSVLNEEILQARYGQLLNYDPLVRNLQDLQAGAERLKALPAVLEKGSEGRERATRQVNDLLQLLEQKEVLLERFKSENSTLHNSLSFFPVAAAELAQSVGPSERDLALDIQALLREVLMYNLHSNEEALPRIQSRIGMLSERQRVHSGALWKEDLRRVLNHGSGILEHKTRLDEITREALEVPIRSTLQELQAGYWQQSHQVELVANNYRLAMYLFALFLMAAIAYSFVRLQSLTLALREANLTLEKRVQERTQDLERATGELTAQRNQLVVKSQELEEALGRETKATAALRDSEMQLALAQEVSHTGNWACEVATDRHFWSVELYRIHGLDPHLTPSRELLLQYVHPEDRLALQQAIDRALKEQSVSELEHRIVRPDGQHRFVQVRVQVLLDSAGASSKVIGTVQDITERKNTQAKLLLSERMASLGTLAGGVAHEINNPLSYVLSNIKFVAGEMESSKDPTPVWLPEAREVLGEALQGAERVERIVQDLLAFARPSREMGPVDVHRVLDLAINMSWSEIRYRARLIKDYAEIPPVHADEARLSQVVLNLLVNAAQAIPTGNPANHEIRVTTRMGAAGQALIELRDTGCGIPPEVRGRLFEPFFTTKEVGKGTGLGLSICHGIVSALGGEITVESEVGKGSTFRVTLPVEVQPAGFNLSSPEVARAQGGARV